MPKIPQGKETGKQKLAGQHSASHTEALEHEVRLSRSNGRETQHSAQGQRVEMAMQETRA